MVEVVNSVVDTEEVVAEPIIVERLPIGVVATRIEELERDVVTGDPTVVLVVAAEEELDLAVAVKTDDTEMVEVEKVGTELVETTAETETVEVVTLETELVETTTELVGAELVETRAELVVSAETEDEKLPLEALVEVLATGTVLDALLQSKPML
ncbi:hypothetical protein LTR16_008981, partial [Cryomyces antarcticus]